MAIPFKSDIEVPNKWSIKRENTTQLLRSDSSSNLYVGTTLYGTEIDGVYINLYSPNNGDIKINSTDGIKISTRNQFYIDAGASTKTTVLYTGTGGISLGSYLGDSTLTGKNITLNANTNLSITKGGQTITVPSKTGTIALLSDIPDYTSKFNSIDGDINNLDSDITTINNNIRSINNRLDDLGFKSGSVSVSSGSATTNFVRRQGNYVVGEITASANKGWGSGATIFTIPSGFRPYQAYNVTIGGTGTTSSGYALCTATLTINTNGTGVCTNIKWGAGSNPSTVNNLRTIDIRFGHSTVAW